MESLKHQFGESKRTKSINNAERLAWLKKKSISSVRKNAGFQSKSKENKMKKEKPTTKL